MSISRYALLMSFAAAALQLHAQASDPPATRPAAPTTAPAEGKDQPPLIVQRQRNAKQIMMGIFMYASENRGFLPDDLEQIRLYLGKWGSLRNPHQPDREKGYVWVKPARKISQVRGAAQALVLYEAYDKWPDDGLVVGFMDGHVEVIKDEKTFKQKLHPPGPVAVR